MDWWQDSGHVIFLVSPAAVYLPPSGGPVSADSPALQSIFVTIFFSKTKHHVATCSLWKFFAEKQNVLVVLSSAGGASNVIPTVTMLVKLGPGVLCESNVCR
jgi:hypothetical protein